MHAQGNIAPLTLPIMSNLQGALDVVIALYLGISIPPISLSLRYTLDCLVAGEGAPFSRRRHNLETGLPILGGLGIALTCPQVSPPFPLCQTSPCQMQRELCSAPT